MTVRLRITLVAGVLAAAAIAVAAVILVTTLRSSLIESADDGSRARARELTAAAANQLLTDPITDIREDGVAQVVADSGEVLAASDNVIGAARISTVVPPEEKPVMIMVRGAPDDDETEDFRVWAVRGDGVTAYVGTSTESVREVIFDLTRMLIFGLPLLLVLFAGGTWAMVGRALRPVEDIRAEVSAISHERLDRRVPPPPTNDEIGRLANTMNEMLGRLEDASNRQRDFVGNASHELRSPLAAFRAQLEVAAAHPEGVDWTSLAEDLLADSNRMESLVQDLLYLAREDADVPARYSPVDLDDVVLEEITRMRNIGGLDVHTEAVSAAPVLGRREDLTRMVRNLLDNAAGYAKNRVDVSLSVTGERVELTVADDGPGVAAEDAPRIFERFFRADAVRNRQTSGTGLGLAIADSVATAHGGAIRVEDNAPGARFVVSLPTLRTAGAGES